MALTWKPAAAFADAVQRELRLEASTRCRSAAWERQELAVLQSLKSMAESESLS
jgi:hypothetical protein